MKKFWLSIRVLISVAVQAQTKSLKSFIGKWTAVNETEAGLQIIDSATMYIVYGDQKKLMANPTFYFSQSPVRFNFDIKDEKQN